MKQFFTFLSICVGTLSFLATPVSGQMVWPGDINNNGIVNGVDLLYWGIGFQNTGPARPDANTSWEAQPMGIPWSQQFPGSSNYAYADANGDGVIDMADATVVNDNFKLNHGTTTADNYQLATDDSAAPMLFEFDTEQAAPAAYSVGHFEIGSAEIPFSSIYGFSFVLEYPPYAVSEEGFSFGLNSPFFQEIDMPESALAFVENDVANGRAEFTFIRTTQANTSGFGKLGKVVINFSDLQNETLPDTLHFEVTKAIVVDMDMNTYPVDFGAFSFLNGHGGGGNPMGPCPNLVDPVCGSNGVTYLNSCFAEAAGIFDYTSGTCFTDDCIDYEEIDPDANCATVYEPVCGCNNITYSNQCLADAAGVVSTTAGPCSTSSCYDPIYTIVSSATSLNPTTGVITMSCGATYDPVCGCNGVTYPNACTAQASGITVYTQGTCGSVCVDVEQMNPDAVCAAVYDPVCGCNGVTYPNACEAAAAGVVAYTAGACGGTSPWCASAQPVQCGDFLPYESTNGEVNNITQYPGCSSSTFNAPEKVYVLNKTSAGDLQIGLEILTSGLDLDLFLLADNCNQVVCLRSSTTSNANTNNEGIIFEDAPIGTYYIVVDGQYANSVGSYRLEVSCGYLYCAEAVPLTCGVPYSGTNAGGNDDVSLYGCDGNVINVENNGPEIVHTFTVTDAGPVEINLYNLTANLELFLLRSCDRGDCVEYSQNPGSNSEQITAFLQAGTYNIVVDGYNGAVGNYTLEVDCDNDCDLTLVNLTSSPSSCGESSGSITIGTYGGNPNYLISYSGPVNGSFTTGANSCTIYNLPPGSYWISKTDYFGCTVSGDVTILGGSNLSATLTPEDAVCMDAGEIHVSISNGQTPYTVYINGPTSGVLDVNYHNFNISNLSAGDYTIHISDNTGCSISQQVTVNHSAGNFTWTHTESPAGCGTYGAIHINTYNGDPPYNIWLDGPVTGGATVYASSFNIIDLPGGTYNVTVEDNNWCTTTQTIVVPDQNISIDLLESEGGCGEDGNIQVFISNGNNSGQYQISWTGPESGTAFSSDNAYLIPNLSSGTYIVTVLDASGCSDSQTVTVNNSEDDDGLTISVIPLHGGCNQNGALWIDIYNGTPTYTITWTGPVSGTTTTNEDGLDIPNLPGGYYTVTIVDINGCSSTQTVYIEANGDLDINLTAQAGICGQNGSIFVSINGGTPNYIVSWSGPSSGSIPTNVNNVNIPNLSAGTYTIDVTDSEGCTDYGVAQVTSTEADIYLTTTVSEANCSTGGTIGLNINGGNAPYQVSWFGPESGNMTALNGSLNISDLTSGAYTIYVSDANGCSESTTATIINNGDLDISLVGNDAICAQFGNIGVYISSGAAPYQIAWFGTVNGSGTSFNSVYQIDNTPPGVYNVVVTDANGCSTSDVVTVNDTNQLQAALFTSNGACGSSGAIQVNILQGTPQFNITWNGPVSGNTTISGNSYLIDDLPSGQYTVVVTDANGCTQTYTETITNTNGDLSITVALIYNVCGQYNTLWVDIIGGTPPYTIIWTGTENGSDTTTENGYEITDLPPGTYKVTVIDANGCMFMQQDIIVYPAPINLFTVVPNDGLCGEDGSITLNITGGTPAYIVSWNGPVSGTQSYPASGTYNLPNLPGGQYTFTLTDQNGCTETETVILNNGESPILITTALIYNECGQYNTIWVDIIGGTPPYTITWIGTENGTGTTTGNGYEITDLPPGTYKVIVVDANGCMVMEQDIIIYPTPIDLFTAIPVNNDCGELGDVIINVTEGTAPFSLTWTGPINGATNVNLGTQTLTGFPSGTYTFILTDANGCAEVETITINNTPSDLEISVALIYNECGQYNTIWVDITGGTPPYTIIWTGTENGSDTTTGNGYEITDLPPGTYKVTVIDANGCMVMQQGIIIYPAPIDLFTATPINGFCNAPGSIIVNVINGTPMYTLNWFGPVSGSTPLAGGSFTIPNLPSGNYTLTLVDMNGCAETEIVTISNTENDLQLSAYGNNGTCQDAASITTQVLGGNQATYTLTWSGPENGTATITNAPYTIPALTPGFYTLFVTDGSGCDDQTTVQVTTTENDLSAFTTANTGVCGENGSINVTVVGGVAPYTVNWTGPNAGTTTIGGNFLNIPNLEAGGYSITINDINGCIFQTSNTIQNTPGDLSVGLTPMNGDCGSNGEIHVNISGGVAPYTISWGGQGSGSVTTNGTFFVIPNLGSGFYTVNVTTTNGCNATASTILTNAENEINIFTNPISGDCGETGSIDVNVSGAESDILVTWSGPVNGSMEIIGTATTIGNLPSGFYTITASSAGCSSSTYTTVTNAEDDLTISAIFTPGPCGQNGAIFATFGGAAAPYTITWNGPVNGTATTVSNSMNIYDLPAGFYTVSVNSGACSDQTTVIVQEPNTTVYFDANPMNSSCEEFGSILVSITAGTAPFDITWSGPVNGGTTTNQLNYNIQDLPNGTYTVQVVDDSNCTMQVVVVIVDGGFGITLDPENGICGDDAAIHVSIEPGNGPYVITWVGPISGTAVTNQSTYDILYLPGGMYHVEVEDASGCVDSGTVTVASGPTDFSVVHMVSNNGCGSFNNIWMDFFNGVGPYTIIWTGTVSGEVTVPSPYYDIVDLPSGIYIITVIDGQGCVDVQIIVVDNVIDNLDVAFTPVNGSCGALGAVSIHINGGSPQYQIDWYQDGSPLGTGQTIQSNFNITNLESGTYWIRVMGANGCEQSETVVINNSSTTLDLDIITAAPGCMANGTIGVLMGGGVAPYTITWTGAGAGSGNSNNISYMITGLIGGDYNIQVVDANGCTGYAIVNLPGGSVGEIVADFEAHTNGLEVEFTNLSNTGSYTWDFGDGNNSNSLSPTHHYANPGVYNVCLTVSASCGSDLYCESIDVTVDGDFALLDVEDGSGGSGSTILVPIMVHNLDNMLSLAGSFRVLDETVAKITGVSAGEVSPYFNPANLTFSYYNNSGQTNSANTDAPIFFLQVELLGEVGETTIIEFTNTPLPIEVGSMIDFAPTVVPYTLSAGTVVINSMGSVQGLVTTYWGDGIMDAEVSVTGNNFDESMMTTETGDYSLPQLPIGQEYAVSVEKDNLPENGLSTYGLFIGQRFLLGMDPVQVTSPYQVVAGDANCNNAFTTLDLYLIQRLIIGVDDDFLNCPSWVFVAQDQSNLMPEEFDAYNVFPYNSQSSMMVTQSEEVDFIGVKVGDILGQANPSMFGAGDDDRNNDDLLFEASNTAVTAGEEVTLYFNSADFADVVSYQFGLIFDAEKASYEAFVPSEVEGFDAVVAGDSNADEGQLRISWYSNDGYGHTAGENLPLFGIRFTALENIENWAEIIRLDPDEMLPEAYTNDGLALDPKIGFASVTDTEAPTADLFELYQNIPNPYKGKTLIGFNLPEADVAKLIVRNLLGETVYIYEEDFGAGYQQILVEQQLPAGVYNYTISVGQRTASKSMIVVD